VTVRRDPDRVDDVADGGFLGESVPSASGESKDGHVAVVDADPPVPLAPQG